MVNLETYARIVGEANVTHASSLISAADASWHAPDIVVVPASTAEVAEVVRQAARAHLKVIPHGGGTGYSGGTTTPDGGVLIDMRRICGILSVDERHDIAHVGAGTTIAAVNQLLRPHGYWWPHDPGSRAMSTVGGVISVRGIGSYHTRYGWAPDTVYGLTIVLADGAVLNLPPRPRGRATGYDLVRLMLSSEGTLGVITEAYIKIWRLPEHRELRLLTFASLPEVEQYLHVVLESGIVPETLLVESKERFLFDFELGSGITAERLHTALAGAEWVVILNLAGAREVAQWQCEALVGMAERAGGRSVTDQEVANAYWLRKTQNMTLDRTAIPTYHVADLGMSGLDLEGLDSIYREMSAMFHLRRKGIRFYVAFPTGEVACSAQVFYDEHSPEETHGALEWTKALAYAVADRGGTASTILGVGVRLTADMAQEHSEQELDLMQGIKAVFDPAGAMNPGKLLPHPKVPST